LAPSGDGLRKISNTPKAGEKCIVLPRADYKADGTPIFLLSLSNQYDQFVYEEFELENCSIFEDIAERSPFVKFITMVLAAFVAFCGICGSMICCSYCHLYWKYGQL